MSDEEEGENNYNQKCDYSYSVNFIIVGDSSVGKSNILLRFSRNIFDSGHQATLGIEFANKHLIYNNTDYLVQIWDTAGQENFRSVTRAYYKASAVAMVVYDITKEELMTALKNLNDVWTSLFKIEQQRIVRKLVKRVEVFPNGVKVQLDLDGLDDLMLTLASNEGKNDN